MQCNGNKKLYAAIKGNFINGINGIFGFGCPAAHFLTIWPFFWSFGQQGQERWAEVTFILLFSCYY
jgi:hypothetical protein